MSHSAKQATLSDNVLINQYLASILLGIPEATLQKYRSTGEVLIPYVKIGRSVRYSTKDLKEWVEANTINRPGIKTS